MHRIDGKKERGYEREFSITGESICDEIKRDHAQSTYYRRNFQKKHIWGYPRNCMKEKNNEIKHRKRAISGGAPYSGIFIEWILFLKKFNCYGIIYTKIISPGRIHPCGYGAEYYGK